MIFYSENNVYEAAKERLRWIFQEFQGRNIVVSFSGGKDSTVILNLTKEVMDELGIKKIPVFFCDQEVESPQTIEYVREVMNLPWVEPYWIQSPFQEWNSSAGKWFNVWGKGEKWCREKEPNNPYTDIEYDKTKHFKEVLHSMLKYHFGEDYVNLGGVRIEESPARRLGLTKGECYDGVTWGKRSGKESLVFYPIWDCVDGFHRNLIERKYPDINERCHGHLPIVVIEKDIDQRMASTVRHNRARGSHSVDGMVNIVFSMMKNGCSEKEICEKVGLEQREFVKLTYITGFAKIFKDYKYSQAIDKIVDVHEKARNHENK